jgi:antibiotic biosynthesis monooxygenase (ABM) superfamily enzyme
MHAVQMKLDYYECNYHHVNYNVELGPMSPNSHLPDFMLMSYLISMQLMMMMFVVVVRRQWLARLAEQNVKTFNEILLASLLERDR